MGRIVREMLIDGRKVRALFDTGSERSYIRGEVAPQTRVSIVGATAMEEWEIKLDPARESSISRGSRGGSSPSSRLPAEFVPALWAFYKRAGEDRVRTALAGGDSSIGSAEPVAALWAGDHIAHDSTTFSSASKGVLTICLETRTLSLSFRIPEALSF
jgi:hypothetical protein